MGISRSSKALITLVFFVVLTGCGGDGLIKSPTWPWGEKEANPQLQGCAAACTTTDMYQSVIAATTYCRAVSNFYDSSRNVNSRTRLGVKVFGVLAGSVFGVTAGGTAAKAWSSLSGASNGIQTDLGDEAVFRSNRARVISGLLERYHEEIKGSLVSRSVSEADRAKVVLASISVSGRCATYSDELPVDQPARMEEKIAEITKLVDDKLKTPEQIAADRIAAEKEAAKLAAADKIQAEKLAAEKAAKEKAAAEEASKSKVKKVSQ
jgi:hypothetical protein